jgi:hypothetical protein
MKKPDFIMLPFLASSVLALARGRTPPHLPVSTLSQDQNLVPVSVALSVGTPLYPYGIAYRRAYELSFRWTVPFSVGSGCSRTTTTPPWVLPRHGYEPQRVALPPMGVHALPFRPWNSQTRLPETLNPKTSPGADWRGTSRPAGGSARF